MKTRIGLFLAVLALGAFTALAQDSGKPTAAKPEDRLPAVTPLHVQVVFTEFDGDKKVSSLPYSFTVNADERRARPSSSERACAVVGSVAIPRRN